MIKLCQEHIDAICHAELSLEAYTEKMESRRVIAQLERDKQKLVELKIYILTSMSPPKLRYKEPGNNGEVPG